MWSNVFSSSGGRVVRSLRPWLGRVGRGRQLSTGRMAWAGVAPGDEAVFTPDHVEMREVAILDVQTYRVMYILLATSDPQQVY